MSCVFHSGGKHSFYNFIFQSPIDHLCVTLSPLQQIEYCFYDLELCVNETEVQNYFDLLMKYIHPEVHSPSKINHFHYRKTLLSDRLGLLYKSVVRELINLIDQFTTNSPVYNKNIQGIRFLSNLHLSVINLQLDAVLSFRYTGYQGQKHVLTVINYCLGFVWCIYNYKASFVT